MTPRDAGRARASRRAEPGGGAPAAPRLIPFTVAVSDADAAPEISDEAAAAVFCALSAEAQAAVTEALRRCAAGEESPVDIDLGPSRDGRSWRLSARRSTESGLSAVLAETPPPSVQALVENAPIEISYRDADRRFLYINPAYAAANGVRPEDVVGRTSEAAEQWMGEQWDEDTRRVTGAGEVLQYLEHGLHEADEAWRRYLTIKFPSYDADRRLVGVGTYSIDVTEIDNESYRMRQMLDGLPEAVFAFDSARRIVACNRAAWALLCPDRLYAGRTDAEIQRRFDALTWLDEGGRPYDDPPFFGGATDEGDRIVGLRLPEPGVDEAAEMHWFAATTRPVDSDAPEAPRRILFLRPFDETMRLRTAQRESERLFRLLAENAIDMIALIGPDRLTRYASPSFKRVLGFEPEALIGGTLFDLMAPHERDRMKLRCEQIMGGAELGAAEFVAYDANGDPRILECTARTVAGRTSVVASLRDITARRRAEGERHILQRVLEGATQGLCLFDALRDEPLTYNNSFSRLLGVPGQGARAFWRRAVAEPEVPEARALFEALDRRISYFGVVKVRAARTGSVTPVRTTIDWIDDPDTGAPRFAACQCDDYSGEYARLSALEQAYSQERQAHVSKAEMMKALGHDLRQPIFALGLIAGAVSPIVEREDPEMATALVRSVESLRRMLGDLAEASALSAQSVTPAPRRFVIRELLERAVEEFLPQAQEAGMALAISDALEEETLVSDPDLVFRIVRNLLSNAIDHSGGTQVSLEARLEASGAVIDVTDDGCGVPEDLAPRIFDDYVRRARSSRDGLGLGLSIVRRTTQLLGGEVRLHTSQRGGARFVVQLPDLIETPSRRGG